MSETFVIVGASLAGGRGGSDSKPGKRKEVIMSNGVETASEIRPFHVEIPEEKLAVLRRRIAATRWPTKELVEDRSQGVQLATLGELARYWPADYDFGRVGAKLNALPQFKTGIHGLNVGSGDAAQLATYVVEKGKPFLVGVSAG